MTTVFLTVLEMAISASFLAAAVMLVRLLFKNAPKPAILVLWAMVAVRLICPFALQSPLSLMPSLPSSDAAVVTDASVSAAPMMNTGERDTLSVLIVATIVWLIGAAAMLVYMSVRYAMMHRRVREATMRDERVYVCDRIGSAFILGVVRPRIYLPSSMKKRDRKYVLAHEQAHLRRGDPWWKLFGFVLLSIYWFHPLMWAAYMLFCRDLELACDEKVIRERGVKIKKAYAQALINCSEPRKIGVLCPLAFGEVGVRTRIKAVLHYKKPAVWLVGAAVVLCAVLAVCFLTDPPASQAEENDEPPVTATTTVPASTTTAVSTTATTTASPTTTTTVLTTTTVYVPPATEAAYIPPTTAYIPPTTTAPPPLVCVVDEEYMSSVNQAIYDSLCTTMTQYKYNPYQAQPDQPYVPDGRATVPQVPAPQGGSIGRAPIY